MDAGLQFPSNFPCDSSVAACIFFNPMMLNAQPNPSTFVIAWTQMRPHGASTWAGGCILQIIVEPCKGHFIDHRLCKIWDLTLIWDSEFCAAVFLFLLLLVSKRHSLATSVKYPSGLQSLHKTLVLGLYKDYVGFSRSSPAMENEMEDEMETKP